MSQPGESMKPGGPGAEEPALASAADEPVAPATADAEDEHAEPNYMAVWGGLFVLTLLEVWVAGLGFARTTTILLLVGMAVWKAALVALYYMHLKFEPRRLWILALSPLPLAVILVVAVLQEY